MQWTAVEQDQLHRFLEGFTNPDPAVQASNVGQLHALSHHPAALVSTLAVLCDGTASATVRLSATTVARQLLRHTDRLPHYLSAASSGPAAAAESITCALLEVAVPSTWSATPCTADALTRPLRRAAGCLIASLLHALASTGLTSSATAVVSHLLSTLLHHTDAALVSAAAVPGEPGQRVAQHGARCAALLRELCETALAPSKELREWVGGGVPQSVSLCSSFTQLLHPLERRLETEQATGGAATRETMSWWEDTLAAFYVCCECGVFPCVTSEFLHSSADEHLPAAQALRTVCAAVLAVQCNIEHLILRRVLLPCLESLRRRVVDGAASSQPCLVSAAPVVAVGMRYMADAIALDAFESRHDVFAAAAVPLLAELCRGVCAAELHYDGAGEPDSVHAAVLACVGFVTDWSQAAAAHLLFPCAADNATHLYGMLVDLAALPPSIAAALEERTTHVPDGAAQLLVTTATGRRRGARSGHTQRELDADAVEEAADTTLVGRGRRDDTFLADALDAALPDNGTLRHAVAWCAASLSCHQGWVLAVAPLVVHGGLAAVDAASPAVVCAAESALFVRNELLDGLLVDEEVMTALTAAAPGELEHSLAAQVRTAVGLLAPSTQPSPDVPVPFFLRVQAVRFLGRLVVGTLAAWERDSAAATAAGMDLSDSRVRRQTDAVMLAAGGVGGLLGLLLGCLAAEVSKAVQVECVKNMSAVVSSCLRVLASVAQTRRRGGDVASDLEEESLDDSSSSSSSSSNSGVVSNCGDAADATTSHDGAAAVAVLAFCSAFGVDSDLGAIVEVLGVVGTHLPTLQWSVRQAVYHLLSDALPSLWQTAPLLEPSLACMAPGASFAQHTCPIRRTTAALLEALAGHYTTLLNTSSPPLLEMATLLTTMSDVATVMDGAALEAVVPWILQVAHHMLHHYAHHLSASAHLGRSLPPESTSGVVDMTDMCMVSLDLVSCVCDAILDRDAVLTQQLPSHSSCDAAAPLDAQMMALTAALLHPISASDGSGAVALPNRCMALLALCQSSPDHPSHTSASPRHSRELGGADVEEGESEDAASASDAFGEVRRASFAIVYDCTFLVAYPSSLFRSSSSATPIRPEVESGLSDALGGELFALCVNELLPSHGSTLSAQLRSTAARNVAASDAWLCLGALLSLWDQQHWLASRCAASGVHLACVSNRGPRSLLTTHGAESPGEVQARVLHTLDSLVALLQDRRATITSTLRLNMTTAACGLAALLCSPPHSHPDPCGTAPSECALPLPTISALCFIASSTRVQAFAAHAARGDLSGIGEAAHILWCVGRVWREAVSRLPHNALCSLVRSHGKDAVKTSVWWTRWVFGSEKRVAAAAATPFWAALVELWRPVAHTLAQAAHGRVLSLTSEQLSALALLQTSYQQ
ncbi:hypothetical protein NESM_000764400 [Novymonas esmeraldas]|uniref:Uncharacterized protein n=1 Tax=Novymonas esmeraldas TaxID=1808958 RepID=A0AAW0EVG6_9TRYP